ncbi:MAG: HAMP domain-containing histidine kinase [Alphaproteobacteria bacterium]|nr:MAG: HAMP domain-containing histidine kinase [Alphaproteobacteria bacterium]
MTPEPSSGEFDRPDRSPRFGLSGKLLLLTILFVMIAEVMIYVPSIANFRLNWLSDRLAVARTVSIVLSARTEPEALDPTDGRIKLPDIVVQQILDSLGAKTVAVKMGNQRKLLAVNDLPHEIHHAVDLREATPMRAVWASLQTLLLRSDSDIVRVVGQGPPGADFIEIVIEEGPLRQAMLRFSRNIVFLSLIISVITAALVYLSLHYLMVRPMNRLTTNMVSFREDPENAARVIVPSGRNDEIGIAERELGVMQRDLASMLQQKSHLAALGLAVSKINHDLRNLLASAQLFSDRLASVPDPNVQRFAPQLMRSLERAIALCQSTLSYGQVKEPPPDRRQVLLEGLVDEVRETLGFSAESPLRWITAVERGMHVDADPDQLFRVVLNLTRNALQALESRAPNEPGRDQLRITGRREGAVAVIEVSDTGPGVSERARLHLFEAFQGSTRRGGSGLGLAIAAELIRAHGGQIRLVDGTIGATFRIIIPDRAVEFGARRGERARA